MNHIGSFTLSIVTMLLAASTQVSAAGNGFAFLDGREQTCWTASAYAGQKTIAPMELKEAGQIQSDGSQIIEKQTSEQMTGVMTDYGASAISQKKPTALLPKGILFGSALAALVFWRRGLAQA